jgi:peptide-methionine (S)-S-oxide reductase
VFGRTKSTVVAPEDALPGRDDAIASPVPHHVHGRAIVPPWPEGHRLAVVGMGCFWGAERLYWSLPGVWTTFVGYAGGTTPNPTYREVCTGRTGHAEVAGIVYDPEVIDYETLLGPVLGEPRPDPGHATGQRRRHPVPLRAAGRRRRAAPVAEASRGATRPADRRRVRHDHDRDRPLGELYWAEPEHQQYLSKVPGGYCNHGFCQVAYDG